MVWGILLLVALLVPIFAIIMELPIRRSWAQKMERYRSLKPPPGT
jgi:hypothetical protein